MSFQSVPVKDLFKLERIPESEFDLFKAGFGWITNNQGVHLQITSNRKVVADYWPTTKRLKFRKVAGFDRTTLHTVVQHCYSKPYKAMT